MTAEEHGLCGACWSGTAFITGAICDTCGAPVMGESHGEVLQCDDCIQTARPWSRGRAVFLYRDIGRRLVLSFKHGDRLDLARPAATWMAQRVDEIVSPETLIVPVPLHWTRLVKRKYNQASVLAQALGAKLGNCVLVDGLVRSTRTPSLDGKGRGDRFETLAQVIAPHPRRGGLMRDRQVLLVDDVMTSGATLAACAEAARGAGAVDVLTVTLARVAKDD